MKTLSTALLAVCCGIGFAGCDTEPRAVYVANGADYDAMSLTDAQEHCDSPGRLAYLTWWGGETLKGCWVRERGFVVGRFPGVPDQRIPVGDFQRTEVAAYRSLTLD